MKTLFVIIAVVFSNLVGGGWIMTDDESGEVIGFSEVGEVDCSDAPIALKEMVGGKSLNNDYYYDHDDDNDHELRLRERLNKVVTAGNVIVSPMIWVKWGQGKYYNSLCPADANGQGGHVQVGCGAIVMGEIMRYWHYPTTGTGSHSYNSSYGTLSANFGNTTYDYDNMPQKLKSTSSEAEVNAVATLLYHCGVAVEMRYGANASTASSWMMVDAMSTYFGFPDDIEYIEKADYTTSQWHQILQSELDAKAPFFYGASGSYGGHVFICDGYRDDNFYHIVWGWNGNYDGWFKIGSFNPGPYDFNNNHAAIIGIRGPVVPASVEDVKSSERDVLVYENPVKNVLRLNGTHSGAIYDMAGRCVMQFDGEKVNVANLTNGVYYLRIENGEGEVIIIGN